MNKKLIFTILFVCLLAFVAIWAFAQTSPNVRWEYTTLSFNQFNNNSINSFIQQANQLGQEGWEVAANGAGGSVVVFKRRLP